MNLNSFAKIDLRFDQSLDYNIDGVLVNSLDAVKPIVDRIKSLGYEGVQLQTNVPINIDTGRIDIFDENAAPGNQDKSLPDDFWKIAQYASDIGLNVCVRADPVDYTNDGTLHKWYQYGPEFSVKEFFNSLVTYQTQLAREAQAAGVDLLYVGSMQGGFDDREFLPDWQRVVNSVRSVFDGELAYMSHYEGYTPVWDLVDVVGVNFDPTLSKTPSLDLKAIMGHYFKIDAPEGRITDVVSAIEQLKALSNKPIILEDVRFDAGDDALGNYIDYFSQAMSNMVIDQVPNTAIQTARIHAFFELLKTELNGVVDGISTREYMPWMQSKWIVNGEGPNGEAFRQLSVNGFDIYNQPEAEKAFAYFLKADNEAIIGTADADNLWIYAGNHFVDGNEGIDTAEFFNPLSYCTVSKNNDTIEVTNWIDGTVTLQNVERLHFSDTNVALDITGTAGQAYRIYKAAFDRAPDAGGLGFWINAMDHGSSLTGVAGGFIASPEFQKLYGANVSDRDYVSKLYNNVLDRNPDQGGYDFWLGALANGASREDILVNFSESKENIANVADLIANGIQYQEWVG